MKAKTCSKCDSKNRDHYVRLRADGSVYTSVWDSTIYNRRGTMCIVCAKRIAEEKTAQKKATV